MLYNCRRRRAVSWIFLWKLLLWAGESLKESVERDEKKKQLEKQISTLENKMKKEKQLNRRMEMNAELKKMRKEWERNNGMQ